MPLKDGWLHKVYKQTLEKKKVKYRADVLRERFRANGTYERWKRSAALLAGKSYATFLENEEREYFRSESLRYDRPINNYKDLARVKIEQDEENMFPTAQEIEEAIEQDAARQAEIAAEQAAADAAAAAEARRRPRILARERDQHIAQLIRAGWDVAEALREVRPQPGISQESWLRGDHPRFATEHAAWLRLVESRALASLADGMRAATMLRKSKKNKPIKYKPIKYKPIKYKSKKNKPKKNKPKKSKGKKGQKITKTLHKTRRKLYRN